MGSGSGQTKRRLQRTGDRDAVAEVERKSESLDRRSATSLLRSSCSLKLEAERMVRLESRESAARAAGFETVAGIDEVGRGSLAGPVYAAAVVLRAEASVPGLDDSKVLLAEVRRELSARIRRRATGFGVGAATPAEIDVLGIVEATFLAMRRALAALMAAGLKVDLVLIDAIRVPGLTIPQEATIRGDASIACISAASILAKTERDRFMEELHGEFPSYGFAAHRGYGTPEHFAALRLVGPSPVHRLSFDGVLPLRSNRPSFARAGAR